MIDKKLRKICAIIITAICFFTTSTLYAASGTEMKSKIEEYNSKNIITKEEKIEDDIKLEDIKNNEVLIKDEENIKENTQENKQSKISEFVFGIIIGAFLILLGSIVNFRLQLTRERYKKRIDIISCLKMQANLIGLTAYSNAQCIILHNYYHACIKASPSKSEYFVRQVNIFQARETEYVIIFQRQISELKKILSDIDYYFINTPELSSLIKHVEEIYLLKINYSFPSGLSLEELNKMMREYVLEAQRKKDEQIMLVLNELIGYLEKDIKKNKENPFKFDFGKVILD